MSEESIKKILGEFGLTERESDVYIFLAKHGVQKGGEISKRTKMSKALVYHILKNLELKGVVESTLEFPARFTAVPFEAVLEMNIRAKREEAALMEKRKGSLIEDWKNISKIGVEQPETARFAVIEGTRKVYLKIAEIIENAKNSLSATLTISDLARIEQYGVIDSINANPNKSIVKFRFLTEVSKQNLKAIKLLKAELNNKLNLKARDPDLGLTSFPRMVVRDDEEILFLISSPKTIQLTKNQEACICTNCRPLVHAFTSIFRGLWQNSTDIEKKITEIKTGKPTPKTLVIPDAEIAKQKYHQTLGVAEKEIILMTSAKDLAHFNENTLPFKDLTKRHVLIKILAPITSENLEKAKLLSEYCEVRHVASSYLGTTIIDGKHLFQFKASPSDKNELDYTLSFKDAFYTTDSQYVEKTKRMLKDIWKKAYNPVKATNYLTMGSNKTVTFNTKRNLQKLPKRLSAAARIHGLMNSGISGTIILEPPKHLKLPTLRFLANHFENARSIMPADLLRIDIWQSTPQGEEFVPVAIVTNAIPEIVTLSKMQFAGTPAGQNVIRVKPDELQVWHKGKTLFAGWTIPIPILDSKYKLDPACIIFETFGEELHSTHSHQLPSGYIMGFEFDGFQAFTTYIGPSWRYSGPGISGSAGNFILVIAEPENKT